LECPAASIDTANSDERTKRRKKTLITSAWSGASNEALA